MHFVRLLGMYDAWRLQRQHLFVRRRQYSKKKPAFENMNKRPHARLSPVIAPQSSGQGVLIKDGRPLVGCQARWQCIRHSAPPDKAR